MSLDTQIKRLKRQYLTFANDSMQAYAAIEKAKGTRDAHRAAIEMEIHLLHLAAALQRFIRDTQQTQVINSTRPTRKMK